MADKFEDLRTFVTVVSCGGVNAAATQLGIAKSAVSRRLSDLEARLGVSLIERTTRNFVITAVGQDYHRQATEILATLQRMDDGVGSSGATAQITIAANTTILAHLVVPAVATIREDGSTPPIRLSSATQEADVIIADDAQPAPESEAHPLITTREIVVASPAYLARRAAPANAGEIGQHEGIVLDAARDGGWRIGGASATPGSILAVPDVETALAACLAGLGLALLPDYAVHAALRDGTLVHVLRGAGTKPRELMAFVHGAAPQGAREVLDRLRGTLRER